ncbi:hypothetical protein NDU88_003266 [Pleurodeles waltl]|uniref:Uncharacterized protein n=1 Tax=Pleurodeles waltl TaxID=8319 RepID=A0AAV7QB96_PLEWA|nr:hypothetical protein NDU88_003266 [Pleurodeles waltl]
MTSRTCSLSACVVRDVEMSVCLPCLSNHWPPPCDSGKGGPLAPTSAAYRCRNEAFFMISLDEAAPLSQQHGRMPERSVRMHKTTAGAA